MFHQEKLCNIMLCDTSRNTVDQEVFDFFIDYFGVSIAGHKEFNKKNRAKKTFSDICTPSDEAFLIFTLECCWDNWYHEYQYKEKTSRTNKYSKAKCNQKYKGMKQDGISKFNELAKSIKLSRKTKMRMNFERNYKLKYEKLVQNCAADNVSEFDETHDSHKPKKAKVIAYTDLGSSEDEEEDLARGKNNQGPSERIVEADTVVSKHNEQSSKIVSPTEPKRPRMVYDNAEDASLDRSRKCPTINSLLETFVSTQ